MQSSLAVLVLGVHLGAGVDQESSSFQVPLNAYDLERRIVKHPSLIHVTKFDVAEFHNVLKASQDVRDVLVLVCLLSHAKS